MSIRIIESGDNSGLQPGIKIEIDNIEIYILQDNISINGNSYIAEFSKNNNHIIDMSCIMCEIKSNILYLQFDIIIHNRKTYTFVYDTLHKNVLFNNADDAILCMDDPLPYIIYDCRLSQVIDCELQTVDFPYLKHISESGN